MEKPTPELVPVWEAMAAFTPTNSPARLSKGYPELPGLIGASVWITSGQELLLLEVSSHWEGKLRLNPLTIPNDMEPCSPNGLPIATKNWPTARSPEAASGRGSTPAGKAST